MPSLLSRPHSDFGSLTQYTLGQSVSEGNDLSGPLHNLQVFLLWNVSEGD